MVETAAMKEKVHKLVEKTSHLALGSPPAPGAEPSIPHAAEVHESIAAFSPTMMSYLQEIYKSLLTSESCKSEFLQKVQIESSDGKEHANPLASLTDFQAYMASPASAALQPPRKQDTSAPITDYFISSSHNTYLTGNQLYSDAAASAYTNVLLGGCRCVEIDVWDGQADSDDEDTSSSSSSSDDEKPHKKEQKERQKHKKLEKEKKATNRRSRINDAVSSKLGGIIGRKSTPQDIPTAGDDNSQDRPAHLPIRPEPRVLHGHTLTKGTTFRDVCNAIRDSAFVVSDLPVIVSLEVHACLEQQEIMVEIMQETWKGLLIDITPELLNSPMPKLEDLKRKILIKVKWLPESVNGEADEAAEDLEEIEVVQSQKSQEGPTAPPPKPSKMLNALSRLAIYTKGFSFKHLDQPEAKIPGHVFSLSESAAKETSQNHRDALFEHNRSNFMRVYPYGLRVNSSNLDPAFHWRRGAQIVALNWQNLDKGTMLNHGMFRGEPGWVQKPQGYRSSEGPSTQVIRQTLDLSIEFFAAQDLSLPPGDTKEKSFHPYVTTCLHVEQPGEETGAATDDNSTDTEKNSYKRTIKSSVGVTPDFGPQTIEFPQVTGIVEELSFVRFKIKDDELGRDSMAAWNCIRLDRLQSGYRLLHFHDCTGWRSGGVVLVKITKKIS